MGPSHRFEHRHHRFEVEAGRSSSGTTVHLLIDGQQVSERPAGFASTTFDLTELDTGLDLEALDLAGARVVAAPAWRRGRVGACRLELPGPVGRERLPFEPPAGTRAHRGYTFRQEHPRLHAARHVVVGGVQVAVAVVGLSLVVNWLPWGAIPWPDWHLPRIDLPAIPWPDLPAIPWPDWRLPDWHLPAWVQAVLDSRQYWLPVLIGAALAAGELDRRRRRQAKEAAAARAEEQH